MGTPRTAAAVGLSTLHDPRQAGAAAAKAACAGLHGAVPTCCLVFSTAGYDHRLLLAGVRTVTGDSKLAGCTGEGVIAGGSSLERDRAVTVLALASTTITANVLMRVDYGTAPEACGTGLAADVAAIGADDAFALLVFADGLTGHCTKFLEALRAALPAHVTIIGGAAGDAMDFTGTYQFAGDRIATGGVSAVLLSGRGHARVAVSHGSRPIGLPRTVTAASDGWLRELDSRPAWSVLKEYLDGDPVDLNADGLVHLSFGAPASPDRLGDGDPFIIHTPLQLDVATGALFFPGGGFRTGERIRLTRRDPELIRASAEACARSLVEASPPAFVLQVDCAGRGRLLFGAQVAAQIIEPLQQVLGRELPWIGFHSYGEIGELAGRPEYHNYTVALCCVWDDSP